MEDEMLKGVFAPEDFADKIEEMRVTGLPRGLSTGWKEMDACYTVKKGLWSVVTGLSGSGKSTWLDNVFINMAKEHGWKFLVCSPENQPMERHVASLMEIYSGRKFGRPNADYPNIPSASYMTEDEHRLSAKFINDHFRFINPPDAEMTIDGIIALAGEAYKNFKFDGMVLDPYNEIEHKRPQGMSETDYISVVITRFRRFTRQLDIHFWFVAHPTKPTRLSIKHQSSETGLTDQRAIFQRINLFDIAGSSHWKSKCDFGLIVHRDFTDPAAPSVVEVEKVRFREHGTSGKEVSMYYDYLCNRFVVQSGDLLWNKLRCESQRY
jgi:twinkle protein